MAYNSQSIGNKIGDIIEFSHVYGMHIISIQEMWVNHTVSVISAMIEALRYKCILHAKERFGGDIGFLFLPFLKLEKSSSSRYNTFELLEVTHKSNKHVYTLANIYRPTYLCVQVHVRSLNLQKFLLPYPDRYFGV